uniref:Sm domain-containing protein n=1 Tax=Syphacia muris TaxID=451379 RepID=A0A0N5AN38_9BILA
MVEESESNCCSSRLKDWLGRDLEVELTDSRIIVGKFMCTDNAPNVILSRCKESWKGESDYRDIGLVIVAGEHIRSIHLLGNPVR